MSEEISKAARNLFATDLNCAQSVLVTVAKAKGSMFDQAASVTAGFGGGIAHEGLVCGAVTGAVMALGLLKSRQITDNTKLKEETNAIAQTFMTRFRSEFGSIICNDLTGIDIRDKKQVSAADSAGIFKNVCMKVVGRAAEIVAELTTSID